MKRVVIVILALSTLAMFSASVIAQEQVEYKVTVKGDVVKGAPGDHFLTFNAPVTIPDATLPAGTYIFTLRGSSVVQVSTAARAPVAMFFTSPVTRLDPADSYEVTLVPVANSGTRRIAKWFLPNEEFGYRFLYASEEARGER